MSLGWRSTAASAGNEDKRGDRHSSPDPTVLHILPEWAAPTGSSRGWRALRFLYRMKTKLAEW